MPKSGFSPGHIYSILGPVPMVVATGASAEEYITDLVPAYTFKVTKVWSNIQVAGTGSSATRLFRLIRTRGTTDTVVASKTIALADTSTKGTVITWTLSTTDTDLTFNDSDKITVDVTGAGTQFTALTMNAYVETRSRLQAVQ